MDFPVHYYDWVAIALMMLGLFALIVSGNLIKKLIGMSIFQTSVLLFYIAMGHISGGHAPIIVQEASGPVTYVNPLPHVLMLTAIVVGVATLAVGLALAARIKRQFGSIEEDAILRSIRQVEYAEYQMHLEESGEREGA